MSQEAECDPLAWISAPITICFSVIVVSRCSSLGAKFACPSPSAAAAHQQPFLEAIGDRRIVLAPIGEIALDEVFQILRKCRQQFCALGLDEIIGLEVAWTVGNDARIG